MSMRTVLLSTALGLAAAALGCGASADPVSESASGADELRSGHARRAIEALKQTNLVSDQEGVAAQTDPDLVNAWGLAFAPVGRAWVSSNGKGLSAVYDDDGKPLLKVTIPTPKGTPPPSAPTGQIFSTLPDAFQHDVFIFVTEQGVIAGWQPSFSDITNAMLRVDSSSNGAIYKGVAMATSHDEPRLYAADFHNNRVDVFDAKYQPVSSCKSFVDDELPADYAPFNIVAHENLLFVTYAKQDADKEDDVKGPGNGFVDVFDADGRLLERLISHGPLNAPWGIAFAPSDFGNASNKLLVGNFGDGRINAYDLSLCGAHLTASFAGPLGDRARRPLVIDGLWAIEFGPGAAGFEKNEIYFTAGPGDEEHGLFGELALPGKED
jgi:uncharacterized protein (TIGR03118 family)